MISHIRGRLLRSSFVESTLRFSTSASCPSKKRDGHDPKVIVGVSEPVTDGSTRSAEKYETESAKLLDDVLQATFSSKRNASKKKNARKGKEEDSEWVDEVTGSKWQKKFNETISEEDAIAASFGEPKRSNFQNVLQNKFERDRARRKQLSQMKPGQLNIKMVDAAKKVAAKAGQEEKKVMTDIINKLDDVFVGIDSVSPGKKKRAFKASPRPPTDIPPVYDKGDLGYRHQDPKQYDDLFAEASRSDSVQEIPRSSDRQFVGMKTLREFQSIEELLKLESPLKIFKQDQQESTESESSTWRTLEKIEILRATRFEPLNWFDQCIVWTEEGKLWHFPINNEQGMDEEAATDFTEHIFLDHHIEHWCPKEGPVKHFMELVTVGLSKNPYITVAKKKETLQWYENYFLQNQALLEEIDAFGKEKEK